MQAGLVIYPSSRLTPKARQYPSPTPPSVSEAFLIQEVLHRDDGTVIGVGTLNDFGVVLSHVLNEVQVFSYFRQGSLAGGEKLWFFFRGPPVRKEGGDTPKSNPNTNTNTNV